MPTLTSLDWLAIALYFSLLLRDVVLRPLWLRLRRAMVLWFGLAAGLGPSVAAGQTGQSPILRIDAASPAVRISPSLYGLMTEEINHSYDGGLYAELVGNRVFLDDPKGPAHWSVVRRKGGAGSIALDVNQPLNPFLTTSLRFDIIAASEAKPAGIANDGYWGIPIRPKTRYHISFYARTAGADFRNVLSVALESADGSRCYATKKIKGSGSGWEFYSTDITTPRGFAPAEGRLVIYAARTGTAWFNLVSCFPPTWHGRPNGNRIDLMRRLADMHPAFLRFPGGNYLEGDTITTRFDWRFTLHGLQDRPGHQGPWGYRSSDGLGLLEYLEWCEDLKMQPLLAVYAGYSLQHDYIPAGPRLQPFVRDALDEIEYVTGGPETRWGAQRAADGHPAPFALEYVEVGNEDNADRSGSYDGRFAQFYDAIKAKYPALQVIATARVKSRAPDVYDQHFYYSAAKMKSSTHHYDTYSRSGPKIFVGEWATMEGSPTPDLGAALADAAWMTGLERNSDLVIMASYAPLLVNVNPGAWQWPTNLIGYDGLRTFGSPSYYAQVMFSRYRGDVVLKSSFDGAPDFFYSATRDSASGAIYLKAVNTGAAPRAVWFEISGAPIAPEGEEIRLSSVSTSDVNTLADPGRVIPVESKHQGLGPSFSHTFAPYSVTVLVLPAKR